MRAGHLTVLHTGDLYAECFSLTVFVCIRLYSDLPDFLFLDPYAYITWPFPIDWVRSLGKGLEVRTRSDSANNLSRDRKDLEDLKDHPWPFRQELKCTKSLPVTFGWRQRNQSRQPSPDNPKPKDPEEPVHIEDRRQSSNSPKIRSVCAEFTKRRPAISLMIHSHFGERHFAHRGQILPLRPFSCYDHAKRLQVRKRPFCLVSKGAICAISTDGTESAHSCDREDAIGRMQQDTESRMNRTGCRKLDAAREAREAREAADAKCIRRTMFANPRSIEHFCAS